MEKIRFKVRNAEKVPLLFHRGNLSDPLDVYAKALKEITKKKKKTDDDYAQMSRIEWEGGLNIRDQKFILKGPWGKIYIPWTYVEGVIREGATLERRRKDAKSGIMCEEDAIFKHDGPESLDALFAFKDKNGDQKFVDKQGVVVSGKRIMRTRPKFDNWSFEVTVQFDKSIVENKECLFNWFRNGAARHGFGDYCPRYGRAIVEMIS